MSARRVAGKWAGLPANPVYIEFPRSDGDVRKWPTNTTRIVSNGEVNYNEHIPLNHATSEKWRKEIGLKIALDKNMPNPDKVVLKDWPANYRMFIHHKGPEHKVRQDVYLYGSQSKYRSINEFIPHAIWLMRDDNTLQPIQCACKYCTNQPQKLISSVIDKVYAHSPTPGTPTSQKDRYAELQKAARRAQGTISKPRQPRPAKELIPKVFATVQKVPREVVPKEATRVGQNVLKTPMLAERADDLRAVYSASANKMQGVGPLPAPIVPAPFDREPTPLKENSGLRRWHRTAEVVWCRLPSEGIAIADDVKIDYWPAIVESANLRCTPIPLEASSSWSVKQRYIYSMRLLGVDTPVIEEDGDRVLPYLAYNPPTALMQTISQLPIELMDFNRHKVATFHPILAATTKDKGKGKAVEGDSSGLQTIYDAGSAFGLACQLAENVSLYWSLTDKYEFRYLPWGPSAKEPTASAPKVTTSSSSTSSSTRTAPSKPPPVRSLANAISATGKSNATGIEYYTHHDISRPVANSSSEQNAQAAVSALGVPRGIPTLNISQSSRAAPLASQSSLAYVSGSGGSISSGPPARQNTSSISTANRGGGAEGSPKGDTQIRYQGLWWGSERIWEGDFIRLKMARGQMAPDGAPNILKPSGPGRQLRLNWIQLQKAKEEQERLREALGPQFDENLARRPELAEFGDKMAKLTPDDVEEWGAKTRGVFMKVNALFLVDLNKEGRNKKEMRISGMLYEVADEDYEEGDDERDWEEDPRPASQVAPNDLPLSASHRNNEDPEVGSSATSEPPQRLDLPQPPHKYKFRPIMTEGYEAVVSLSLVAGRYYPRICCHPIIAEALHKSLAWTGNRLDFKQIWALEGMYPGYHADTSAGVFKKSRTVMIEDADNQATRELQAFQEKMRQRVSSTEEDGEEDVQMEDAPSASQNMPATANFGRPVGLEANGMDIDAA